MKKQYKVFIFEDYKFDKELKELVLIYSFDSEVFFEEKIKFDFEFIENYSEKTLDRAFFSLWVMAGISYFKASLPAKISFKKGSLNLSQAKFFNKIYDHGLGEFFYMNDLNPKGKINFEANKGNEVDCHASLRSARNDNSSLVPLGGGKDSLTTIEILKSAGINFDTITIDSDSRFEKVSQIISKNHINVSRTISPQLIELNKQGALNGHVPISAIWAFIFVCVAVLRGDRNIILSNENSANEATTKYKGVLINHQYSKSLEFEKDLQKYITGNITLEINYFSFLRPLSELHIAQIFCSKIVDKYKGNFSSCNKNFKILKGNKIKFSWCNACSKCAFVFTIFSAFLSKTKLLDIFGENLYEKPELKETFIELLGLTESKPFECVGEVIEVRKAMIMAQQNFPEVEKFLSKLSTKQLKEAENFDYEILHESSMGDEFKESLKNHLKKSLF